MPYQTKKELIQFFYANAAFFVGSYVEPEYYQNEVLPNFERLKKLHDQFFNVFQHQASLKSFSLASKIYIQGNLKKWEKWLEHIISLYTEAMVGKEFLHDKSKPGGLLAGDVTALELFIDHHPVFLKFMIENASTIESVIKEWNTHFAKKQNDLILKKSVNSSVKENSAINNLIKYITSIRSSSRNGRLNNQLDSFIKKVFQACQKPEVECNHSIEQEYNRLKDIVNDPVLFRRSDDILEELKKGSPSKSPSFSK